MTYQPKDMSFSLFPNTRKSDERHPDMTGTALIDGQEYYVDAWRKQGQRGEFFSGRLKLKQAPRQQAQPKQQGGWSGQKAGGYNDDNEGIPFAAKGAWE